MTLMAQKVAQRYIQRCAGIFEFPPKLKDPIWEWARAQYASHILAHVETTLLRTQGWPQRKKELKAKYTLIKAQLPSELAKLAFGMDYLFLIGEPRPQKIGVKRIDDDLDTKEPRYIWGHGDTKTPFKWHFRLRGGQSSQEIQKLILSLIDDGIQTLDMAASLIPDDRAVELLLLRKECLKYTSKSKSLKGTVKKQFPIDLAGWKYAPSVWREALNLTTPSLSDFTVVFSPKRHAAYVGRWTSSKMLLELDAPNYTPSTVPLFYEALSSMEETLEHELQHLGQHLLDVLSNREMNTTGIPSKSISAPVSLPKGKKRPQHDLQDVEFYTELLGSVKKFVEAVHRVPVSKRRWALRKWVGLSNKPRPDVTFMMEDAFKPSEFFTLLKRAAPDKWKKAVLEFTKAVSQKIDIPREG